MSIFPKNQYDKGVLKLRLGKLKQIFDYTGFSYLWGYTGVVNDRYIKAAVKMRISKPLAKLIDLICLTIASV